MHSIRQTIKDLCNPTDEQLEEICSALTPKELKKGQLLLSEGQVCRQYYFLEQGTLRLFYNKGINEFTVWMGTSGEVFTNLESYLPEKPSVINIKAIEPSKIYFINKKDSDQLALKSNTYNTLLRKTVEISFVNLAKNVMSFQSDDAAERYRRVEEEKNWISKYPLKYISSFIGITQSSLSKLRARKD
ncbi:MAG: Crp/Fnr family transcriptional regulator [Roseivirga sp.]